MDEALITVQVADWTLWQAIFLVITYYIGVYSYAVYARPKILIVEDSPIDQTLYKHWMADLVTKCDIRYFRALSEIKHLDLLPKPKAVVVDEHLAGTHKGKELLLSCIKRGIYVYMVTCDTHVEGVPKSKIIQKTPTNEHYKIIRNWLDSLVTQ